MLRFEQEIGIYKFINKNMRGVKRFFVIKATYMAQKFN